MKLTFNNVGRFFEKTELEINGITIIAGKNGTGKSTISKLFYCIFDSLHDIGKQIEDNRVANISRILDGSTGNYVRYNAIRDIAFEVVSSYNNYFSVETFLQILKQNEYPIEQLDENSVQELCKSIVKALDISDKQILENLVIRRFRAEFDKYLQHVNYCDTISDINLQIKDENINIILDHDNLTLQGEFNLVKDIIYLDDLSSLSSLFSIRRNIDPFSHTYQLRKKVYRIKDNDNDVVDRILAEKRYSTIISKMEDINIGDLVESYAGSMEYRVKGLKTNLSMANVSAGTKVFAIIKKLITNGYIEENGMIVLDEPEVHLHPEWQMALAEMIAIMQSELKVNFLISTHSADFIAFIKYYSRRLGIFDRCKFYKAVTNSDFTSALVDTTDNIQDIFCDLGLPFIRVTEEDE